MSDEKKIEAPKAEAPKPAGPPPPPPPKNPGFVTFSVDGREVVAKPGTNMVDAAKTVGVEIPTYCYHPRLSVAASCRMCMVESSTAPKLVPACQTPIAEGMAVKTNTPKVRDQQKMVMEFLLLNHPVDCPICDQAGECKLQDYYVKYDHKPSRLTGPKVLRNKRKVLNELVVLDQERCVLCTRCVRFMEEVAQAPQLGVFGRGSHEVIDVAPHYGKLESNYSGNIVDLCPVGALLNRDFRFRARAWFLSAAPSVCTGCSRGCNTWADYMGQDVFRYRPRENEQVNKSWLCDEGRLTYKSLSKHRVLQSVLGSGPEGREVGHDEAVKTVAGKLEGLKGKTAVMVSPVLSNEDALAALTFARDALGLKVAYLSGRADGKADFLLVTADKNPNRRGVTAIAKALGVELKTFGELEKALDGGQVKALLGFGHDVPVDEAGFAARVGKLEFFALTATNESKVTAAAHAVLAAASHVEDEGSFTNGDGLTQRLRRAFPPRGAALPTWKWAAQLSGALGKPMAVSSSREVFKTLSPGVPELAAYEWDAQAPINQSKPGITPLAAASDGRPPGWREQGVPNLRGLSLPKES